MSRQRRSTEVVWPGGEPTLGKLPHLLLDEVVRKNRPRTAPDTDMSGALRRQRVATHTAHMVRAPLVLTGGPAVGKTLTARHLAERRPRCAVIDVDDIRQLMLTGAAAPWQGFEGARQQRLGVANACALARNFLAEGIEVIVADVVTPASLRLYRRELPSCLVVHLVVSRAEALSRARSRIAWLTEVEFDTLHEVDAHNPPGADVRIQVDEFDETSQANAVQACWAQRLIQMRASWRRTNRRSPTRRRHRVLQRRRPQRQVSPQWVR
jgi:predicted kinase